MSRVSADIRVCPRCGASAGHDDVCAVCGLHLAELPELPTRAEWEAATERRFGEDHRSHAEEGRRPHAEERGRPTVPGERSVTPLLHPSERSRLVVAVAALALFAVFVLAVFIQAGAAGVLGYVVGALVFFAASIWVALQVARATQLGRSLRVDEEAFPRLHAIVENVKETLEYDRPVEVYVGAKEAAPITRTNYLGQRILILDGELVGSLLADGDERQLTFLIGREIGAFKARLTRLDIFVVLLNAVNALKVVSPFLLPYYRATVYSGDQIGVACAGDLAAALEATRRLLVGEKLASTLGAGVVVPQALLVQRRLLPRVAQFFVAEPHMTNRYANLLCFGRYHDPSTWDEIARTLTPPETSAFEELWRRSPYRRYA